MKILLVGATGQMGQAVTSIAETEIAAGIGNKNMPYPMYQSFKDIKENIDVIIDFSAPDLLADMLEYAQNNALPIVIATTGYSDNAIEQIKEAAKEIPIVYAGNYSLGINVMEQVTQTVAKALKNFDIEIIETHHNLKKDAPSGTANMLFQAVNEGRNHTLHKLEGRNGFYDGRDKNEVGMASLRGGTVVGEHSVFFYGEDEVLEIKHTAFSKRIFAKGALEAALYIKDKAHGLYNVTDVLEG